MSSDLSTQAAPRAGAVAEAPVGALVADVEELARRWAIALILARPIERIGETHLEDIGREAPGLCAQVARALGSDAELERITWKGSARSEGASMASTPGGTLAMLAGARDGPAIVEAAEALRGVVWEALLDELGWGSADRSRARLLAELGDRLAYVCAMTLAAALATEGEAGVREAAKLGGIAVYEPDHAPSERGTVVLVDEWVPEPASSPRRARPASAVGGTPGQSPPPSSSARALPWDTPLFTAARTGPRTAPQQPSQESAASVEQHDAAGGDRPVMRVTRRPTSPPDVCP